MNLFADRNIKPMLLQEIDKPFDDPQYLFEIKYDGIRAIIFVSPNEIDIISRNGKRLNDFFPELIKIKNEIKNKCIFDGEIVLFKKGKPQFEPLLKRVRTKSKTKIKELMKNNQVSFICFDLLYENEELIDYPLLARKQKLAKYKDTELFIKSSYIDTKGISFFKAAVKQQLEGIVAKKKNSIYQVNKRSDDWKKIKKWKDSEFYILAIDENKGNNVSSLILGTKLNNRYYYVGKVMIGKNNPDYRIIKEQKKVQQYIFYKESLKNYTFINPKLQATIKFLEKTSGGGLRQPIYKSLKIKSS